MKAMMRTVLIALLASAAFAQWGEEDDMRRKWCGDANCYEVLGITSTTTAMDKKKGKATKARAIKDAYKALAKKNHPDQLVKMPEADRNAATEKFKQVAQAYEILKSTADRAKYDRYLAIKKTMDSPQESPIVVLILLFIVTFAIVHLWKKQKYEKIRDTILNRNDIKSWITKKYPASFPQAKPTGELSHKQKKQLKKARKLKSTSAPSGDEDKDENAGFTDEMITEGLEAQNYATPQGWEGKPNVVSTLMATLWLPFGFLVLTYTNLRWLVCYGALRKDYSDADCTYLVISQLELSEADWNLMTNEEKSEAIKGSDALKDKNKKDKPETRRVKQLLNAVEAEEGAKEKES